MQIRVLQVGKFFPPDPGGIETTTKDIFLTDGNNYSSDILCFSTTLKTVVENYPQGKIIRCGTLFKIASMPFSISYYYYFKKMHKSYDVIHVHHPNPLAFVCLLFLKLQAKLIIHWHSDILNKGIFYTLFSPIEKRVLKKATHIIGTSPVYIEKSPMVQKVLLKSSFVPSAFDHSSLKANQTAIDDLKHTYNNRKIVFALGRHVNYKGFHFLINAAKLLPDDVVVLIGGTGPLYDFHKNLITELQLTDKVFLTGKIPNEQLGNYYSACDIFCLPSSHKSEAFGLVMVEAMCFSKPVVATNIPGSGVSWVNQHEVTGLNAENENEESLAEKLSILLKNDSVRAEYGANARKRYIENFTVEQLRKSLDELYQKIYLQKI